MRGQRNAFASLPADCKDHPRSCGANQSTASRKLSGEIPGSSPLVRGQLRRGEWGLPRQRIIPARAGPTCIIYGVSHDTPDHPRSCGANIAFPHSKPGVFGSSPLVRGQLSVEFSTQGRLRIIPARAGPTCSSILYAVTTSDHPRSCGANLLMCSVRLEYSGSSPLVRGQLTFLLPMYERRRIIPARAGPTMYSTPVFNTFADHPRSCGANFCKIPRHVSNVGSSPLVRGQQPGDVIQLTPKRIIPARAGPTNRSDGSEVHHADHPRSCGANSLFSVASINHLGSSPLVRGQPPLE